MTGLSRVADGDRMCKSRKGSPKPVAGRRGRPGATEQAPLAHSDVQRTQTRSRRLSVVVDLKNGKPIERGWLKGGALVSTVPRWAKFHKSAHRAKGPLRVLVAEDEGFLREAAVQALARWGMIVHKTAKPGNVVGMVRRFRPDVVVLDDHFKAAGVSFSVLMPDLIGMFPNVRVVVTTERPLSELTSANDPAKWGASDVVWKSTMLHGHELERSVANVARG